MVKKPHRPAKANAQKPWRASRHSPSSGRTSSPLGGAHDGGHDGLPAAPQQERGRFDLADVHVEAEEEARALTSLVLADRLEALLVWARPGRGVTASGALRRADLAGTAALVGADVRPATDEEVADLDVEPGTLVTPLSVGHGHVHVQPVHVMRDVIPLARAWRTCRELGLLDVGTTRVRLSGAGAAWLDADDVARVEARRRAVVAYLTHVLTVDLHRIPVFAGLTGRVAAMELLSLLAQGPRPPGASSGNPLAGLLGGGELERLTREGVVLTGRLTRLAPGLEAVVAEALVAYFRQAGAA